MLSQGIIEVNYLTLIVAIIAIISGLLIILQFSRQKYENQLKVLQESIDAINKDIRYFKIETTLIDDLLTFLKQKKYKELQEIIEGKRELVYFEIPDDLCKVLNVIIKNESLSKNELAKMAGLTRKRLGDWLVLLKKTGVLMDSFKEDSEDIYIFSSSRSKKVLEYINNGAYEKDKELKQLWKLTNS